MAKVVFDISISLDGYVTAGGQTAEEPLGDGGQQLHDWAFRDEEGEALLKDLAGTAGATVCGRRTYEDSLPWWDANGPTGDLRIPTIVVTHEAPGTSPEDGVYEFFTDGIEAAIERAKAIAGEKDVSVMGGADIGRQAIAAGLVDEISLHLVPVIFGAGTALFGETDEVINLEQIDAVPTERATHLRYRVVR